MKKNILIIIVFMFISSVFAESPELVDLKASLESRNLDPEKKLEILLKISEFRKDIDPQQMMEYADNALEICEKNNLLKQKAKVYYWKADLYYRQNDKENSLSYLDKGYKIAESLESEVLLALFHYNKGFMHIRIREYRSAEIELLEALKYSDVLKPAQQLRIYNNLSNIYYYYSDFAPSLSYSLKQLDLANIENNLKEQVYANVSLGNIYNDLGNLEMARDYYLEAIVLAKQMDAEEIIYTINNNLGIIYTKMEDYDSSGKLYQEVLEKAKEYNDENIIFYTYQNIGMIEINKRGDYQKALDYFLLAEEYSHDIPYESELALMHLNFGTAYFHLGEYEHAKKSLEQSKMLAEKVNDYNSVKHALETMMKISMKKDGLYSPENLMSNYLDVLKEINKDAVLQVSEIHRQYTQEKFDNQLEILKQKEQINMLNMHKQQRVTFFIIVFLLIIVLAFFYVIYMNTKLKALKNSLEVKVKENLEKLHTQESLLIMQNHQASMGEMLSMIAHQWKQPLNSIGLIAQNLGDAYEYDEFSEELLDDSIKNIMEQINLMANTLNSFRDYYKFGKDDIFELSETIESSISYCKPIFKKYRINAVNNAEASHLIYGQKNLLIQVILILVNNARDAFEENSIDKRKIIIDTESLDNKSVRLSITDNAGGIPGIHLQKIFKPYFTTKKDDKGTGIGLYIAQSVLQQKFKGSIKAVNIDAGCRFIIELPISHGE